MPPLTELKMQPLNKALISKQPKEYYQEHPELGILRLDRSTFWVFDKSAGLGYYVSQWDTAQSLFNQLEGTEF